MTQKHEERGPAQLSSFRAPGFAKSSGAIHPANPRLVRKSSRKAKISRLMRSAVCGWDTPWVSFARVNLRTDYNQNLL